MREIKFRCWFPKMGRFLDKSDDILDGLINLSNGKRVFNIDDYLNKEIREIDYFSDDGYVLNQYAGLKDKNGADIYEGDIVQTKNSKYRVEYDKCCFWGIDEMGKYPIYQIKHYIMEDEIFKVIGNIYENPELLEGK